MIPESSGVVETPKSKLPVHLHASKQVPSAGFLSSRSFRHSLSSSPPADPAYQQSQLQKTSKSSSGVNLLKESGPRRPSFMTGSRKFVSSCFVSNVLAQLLTAWNRVTDARNKDQF